MSDDHTTTPIDYQELCERARKGRQEKLSPERRSEIARQASHSRKAYANLPKATHVGELHIGDISIACAVLEDGRRVITQSSMFRVMGRNPTSAKGRGRTPKLVQTARESGRQIPVFVASNNLIPFISNDLEASAAAIEFMYPKSGKAKGYEATLLPEICAAYLDAREKNLLTAIQQPIAETCHIIQKSLSKVGIISLIDETTGYQKQREQNELQRLLDKFIAKELQPWTRRFPDEFFTAACGLYGHEFKKGKLKPQYLGGFINKYVYNMLPEGVLKELKEKNPVTDAGYRKSCHHQWLTPDLGHEQLTKQVLLITYLAKASNSKSQFDELMEKAFKKS